MMPPMEAVHKRPRVDVERRPNAVAGTGATPTGDAYCRAPGWGDAIINVSAAMVSAREGACNT